MRDKRYRYIQSSYDWWDFNSWCDSGRHMSSELYYMHGAKTTCMSRTWQLNTATRVSRAGNSKTCWMQIKHKVTAVTVAVKDVINEDVGCSLCLLWDPWTGVFCFVTIRLQILANIFIRIYQWNFFIFFLNSEACASEKKKTKVPYVLGWPYSSLYKCLNIM